MITTAVQPSSHPPKHRSSLFDLGSGGGRRRKKKGGSSSESGQNTSDEYDDDGAPGVGAKASPPPSSIIGSPKSVISRCSSFGAFLFVAYSAALLVAATSAATGGGDDNDDGLSWWWSRRNYVTRVVAVSDVSAALSNASENYRISPRPSPRGVQQLRSQIYRNWLGVASSLDCSSSSQQRSRDHDDGDVFLGGNSSAHDEFRVDLKSPVCHCVMAAFLHHLNHCSDALSRIGGEEAVEEIITHQKDWYLPTIRGCAWSNLLTRSDDPAFELSSSSGSHCSISSSGDDRGIELCPFVALSMILGASCIFSSSYVVDSILDCFGVCSSRRLVVTTLYSSLVVGVIVSCCILSSSSPGSAATTTTMWVQLLVYTLLFLIAYAPRAAMKILSRRLKKKKTTASLVRGGEEEDDEGDHTFWRGYSVQLPMMILMVDSIVGRVDFFTITSGMVAGIVVSMLGKCLVDCNHLRGKVVAGSSGNNNNNGSSNRRRIDLIRVVDERGRAMLFSSSMATWSVIQGKSTMRYFVDSPVVVPMTGGGGGGGHDYRYAVEFILFLYSMIPFMDLPAISEFAWPNSWRQDPLSPRAGRVVAERFLQACLAVILVTMIYS